MTFRRFLLLCILAVPLVASAQTTRRERTPHPKCLTPLFFEREFAPEKMDPSLLALMNGWCAGPADQYGRPIKSNSVLSSSMRFRIHYDLSGKDSVSVADANSNGIPDYVDSVMYYLEYAWEVEVDLYGFAAPPSDRRGPGPEVDVYICELSAQFYGGAQFETDNVLGTDPTRVAGYLVLDNDYRGYPTSGIDGLKVTTAHEFHHLIQFGAYRIALPPFSSVGQYALYESTSTWFEKRVHPTIPDYRQYVDAFLGAPHLYGYSTHAVNDNVTGYAHMLYLEYLTTRFGANVVHEIWEQFRSHETFEAIDRALAPYDFNLYRSYCEFAEWSYYTGYRARDTSLLREAPNLPAMRTAGIYPLDEGEVSIEASLFPLSFGLYRTIVPTDHPNVRDTVDFLVTNARSDIGAGGPNVRQEPFRIHVTRNRTAGYVPFTFDTDTIYYQFTAPGGTGSFCLDAIDDSIRMILAVRLSPQPFINRPGEELLFAVGGGDPIRTVKIWIYSQSGVRIAEIEPKGLGVRDNQLGVLWDGKDYRGQKVASGIYLYEMSINGAAPVLGKFAVVRAE